VAIENAGSSTANGTATTSGAAASGSTTKTSGAETNFVGVGAAVSVFAVGVAALLL
jgi:hypothetical protein